MGRDFIAKGIAAEKVRAGLRHAVDVVVWPNVMGGTKASVFGLVRSLQLIADVMLYFSGVTFVLFLFCFVFALMLFD